MGMYAFRLTLLFCISTISNPVESARFLDNNSSDLWGNLLLKEDQELPLPQSAPLSRRITPKSIFIVPSRDLCPPHHTLDPGGKCVRLVAVDEDANKNLLLQKLKFAFSMTSRPREPLFERATTTTTTSAIITTTTTTTTKHPEVAVENVTKMSDDTNASGPLQLSIPINGRKNMSDYDEDAGSVALQSTVSKVLANSSSSRLDKPMSLNMGAGVNTEAVLTEATTDAHTAATESTTLWESAPGSTFVADIFASEMTTTELPDTTTLPPELPEKSTIDMSMSGVSPLLYGTNAAAAGGSNFDGSRDETTTNRVYRIPGHDLLKTSVRFPADMSDKQGNIAPGSVAFGDIGPPSDNRRDKISNATPLDGSRPTINLNFKRVNTKESSLPAASHNDGFAVAHGGHLPIRGSSAMSDNSDSKLSASGSFAFSNSDNSDSSISSSISHSSSSVSSSSSSSVSSSGSVRNPIYKYENKDQKLPTSPSGGNVAISSASERLHPKCDPTTGFGNCGSGGSQQSSSVKNVFAPEKSVFAVNRGPPAYIRFPGFVAGNGHPFVRFPSSSAAHIAHKSSAGQHVDEMVALAEANGGFRHWESSRYTAPAYWTPQFVQIWPDHPLNNIDGGNQHGHGYGSRSQAAVGFA